MAFSTETLIIIFFPDLKKGARMREASFTHQPKKYEFDYNAAVSFNQFTFTFSYFFFFYFFWSRHPLTTVIYNIEVATLHLGSVLLESIQLFVLFYPLRLYISSDS